MSLTATVLKKFLQDFQLAKLFTQELGWDKYAAPLSVIVAGQTYALRGVAEKRGVRVFQCPTDPVTGCVPDYATRRAIEKEVTKFAIEHLIIFVDVAKSAQVWQWVARRPGQPAAYREVSWQKDQSAEALAQKLNGIHIALSEEESLDLVGTVTRLRDAFDRDKVTKKFFDHFQKEHAAFLTFIAGIVAEGDRAWYASLMLNRLMFIYFIQKKGFLAGDTDYLSNRLQQVRERKKKFQSFYRAFLMALFHEGFSKQPKDRQLDPELVALIGKVPYLNGGLFDVHELEANNAALEIPDEAFEKLFAFFDKYEWHLDSRALAEGNEINPDVLGHIFEKFINQKQMGAYYTKEDITDYIGKNTIIPRLFDAAKPQCEIAFAPGSALWRLLAENPDRYLYRAVRHGVIGENGDVLPLPADIERGVLDVAQRGGWNKSAPAAFALPTETWREHIARRQRCLRVRATLVAGEIHTINDLITLNLDIRQFASDAVAGCEGPELLRAFYDAVRNVTVLDPTCGSGAFLFAALNILQPLYDACLDRMAAFVADAEPKAFTDFREILNEAERHPSRDYFVLKSIVVRNLYGVDIMAEAVEICKLRLFLKLVAQVDSVEQLEPLPDIDFNIRAGNTLVGFATKADVKKAFAGTLDFGNAVETIEQSAGELARQFRLFQEFQTSLQDGQLSLNYSKTDLRAGLDSLRTTLDTALAGLYGIDPDNAPKFAAWQASHHPFHWFAEFYTIMASGGFDVIVGNPPYIEYKEVKNIYQLPDSFKSYATNLYSATCYRANALSSPVSYAAFIVPVSLPSTDRLEPLRKIITESKSVYCSHFSTRPSKLFEGAEQRLTVYIQTPAKGKRLYTTKYYKWSAIERSSLFAILHYQEQQSNSDRCSAWPKSEAGPESSIYQKMRTFATLGNSEYLGNGTKLYYKNTGLRYFNSVTLRAPKCWINGVATSSSRETVLSVKSNAVSAVHALLISSTYFIYYQVMSNCRDLNPVDITSFPAPGNLEGDARLTSLSHAANDDCFSKAVILTMNTKQTGKVELESVSPARSKPILDEIDRVLAEHYGFTAEELDFIINYDIKYRMGADAGEDDS